MYIIGAHEMMTLGASVGVTVGALSGPSYNADELCDGDTDTPVRSTNGTVSFIVSGQSMAVNALIVAGHNLNAAQNVGFSGLGTVVMPTVPPGGIRMNGWIAIASVTVSSTTVSVAGGPSTGVVISEAIAGFVRAVRTMPPRSGKPHKPFNIVPNDEHGGLAYDRGGIARSYGGSVLVDDAMLQILQDAYDASRRNSLPTVIIPNPSINDAWVVKWDSFEPQQDSPNLHLVTVQWTELPRYEHY